MACECGCGLEGEDPVTQWLIEEAAFLAADAQDAQAERLAYEQAEADAGLESSRARLEAMARRHLEGRA